MTDKGSVSPVEQPVRVKEKKNKTCMRHCKKFWWAYLCLFIVIVVLAVCLILLVAIPKIAQKKLDHSELQVDGISVTNTRSETYLMGINSTIRSSGGVSAKIAPFRAEMYLEDLEPHTPFVLLDFPETTSAELQTVNVTDKRIEIPNMEAFTTFNTMLLGQESVRVTIKGDTTVRVSGVARNYGVTFKKTITLTGLNHFAGLEVTHAEVSTEPDENDNNFHGFVTIPNPSVLTIEIGNATFDTFLNGSNVGTTYMDNLILSPGNNNASLRASISQGPVLLALMEEPYCQDGIIDFELSGNGVTNEGDKLSYFADALSADNLTVPINIGESVARDLGVTLGCSSSGNSSRLLI